MTDSGHGAGSPRLTYASKGSLANAEYCGLFEAWVRKVHRAPPPIHASLVRRSVAIGWESSSSARPSLTNWPSRHLYAPRIEAEGQPKRPRLGVCSTCTSSQHALPEEPSAWSIGTLSVGASGVSGGRCSLRLAFGAHAAAQVCVCRLGRYRPLAR